jgi:hypothetical protein
VLTNRGTTGHEEGPGLLCYVMFRLPQPVFAHGGHQPIFLPLSPAQKADVELQQEGNVTLDKAG